MEKLSISIAIVFGVFLLSTSFLQAQKKVKTKEQAEESECLVAAYVWPSCHDDSLGSAAVGLFGPKVQTLAGEWQIHPSLDSDGLAVGYIHRAVSAPRCLTRPTRSGHWDQGGIPQSTRTSDLSCLASQWSCHAKSF